MLLCTGGDIFGVGVGGGEAEEIYCHNISESWCTVHCWGLYVIVRYPLVFVVFVIAFVEDFYVFVCQEIYFRPNCNLYGESVLLLNN